MLVQLQPDQIAKYWPQVRFAVENAFPPTVKEKPDMNKVLEALLAGELLAWASIDDTTKEIVAIATTMFIFDVCTGTKNLLLYTTLSTAKEKIGRKNWIDAFATMMKYAKEKGCSNMVAYTKNDAIVRMAEFFGGDTGWTLVSFPIK